MYGKNLSQPFQSFGDPKQNCFSNVVSWKYDNPMNSSVTIFAESFQINQTYQFMVQMIDRHNSSDGFIGYLIVKIQRIQSPIIIIR